MWGIQIDFSLDKWFQMKKLSTTEFYNSSRYTTLFFSFLCLRSFNFKIWILTCEHFKLHFGTIDYLNMLWSMWNYIKELSKTYCLSVWIPIKLNKKKVEDNLRRWHGQQLWQVISKLGEGPYKVVFGNSYILEMLQGDSLPRVINMRYLERYFPSIWQET